MFKRFIKRVLIFGGASLLLVFIAFCFVSYRFASPERVIQKFHSAVLEGDFDKAYSCLSASQKSKLGKYEFITQISGALPFEMAEEQREELFRKICGLAK